MAKETAPLWDGKIFPYRASEELQIHETLDLHSDVLSGIDPIDHEVLRFALWNVNVEHGNTIIRMSGSPAAVYAHDFNPVILDERGDYVMTGPYLQYLSSAASSAVKWTLENRAENPGIHPGDIFLTNDPWIAASHQPDVTLMMPLFLEDKVFAWVVNTLHQWDLGGTTPGGFNPIAPDVYWEAPCIPPIKIVERGELRKDIEDLYTRFSRVPDLVGIDLRAQIVGCRTASDRLAELTDKYGAGMVKSCMRKLQDDSESAFVNRLKTIPDGSWSGEGWMEASGPGDRSVYKNKMTLKKLGEQLVFTNEGTNEQIGALNSTFVAWRGACLAMLMSQMLFDQMFVIEGALRHLTFEAEPGLMTCAKRPAAVSASPPGTLMNSIGLSGILVSKMLATSTDPELRKEVSSCIGSLSFPVNAIEGIDQRGNSYASFFLDPVGAAIAAHSWRDGQDTGGWAWDLQSTMPNVEDQELFYPILYLWRRELPDSGGAGMYRGGNSAELAFTPHKTESVAISTVSSQVAVPGWGLFGGYPTSTVSFEVVRTDELKQGLSSGAPIPSSPDELTGERSWVLAKSHGNVLQENDVWICSWAGAGSYGDPLLREPSSVETDVEMGRVTSSWAKAVYGVVIGDFEATDSLRKRLLQERIGSKPTKVVDIKAPALGIAIHESLEIREGSVVCRPSNTRICDSNENWKEHVPTRVLPISELNPRLRDPSIYIDAKVEGRQYFCPSSGLLLETEILVDGAPHSRDTFVEI